MRKLPEQAVLKTDAPAGLPRGILRLVAELNSTPEPFTFIAACMISAAFIRLSSVIRTGLAKGKVIIMDLWARCKGQSVAAVSVWVLYLWTMLTATESG
ncbi:hypothetical protein [Streptomyces atroolivaceus]|uniref:hypothetical protein n=1 Tax=Streptomyces atroolivaceus TaxID=66869 RepID=UPI00367FA1BE